MTCINLLKNTESILAIINMELIFSTYFLEKPGFDSGFPYGPSCPARSEF